MFELLPSTLWKWIGIRGCDALKHFKSDEAEEVIHFYILFLKSQNLALKILLDSCGHHSLSFYEKEKLGLSAINNSFCVSKESHGFQRHDGRIFILGELVPK